MLTESGPNILLTLSELRVSVPGSFVRIEHNMNESQSPEITAAGCEATSGSAPQIKPRRTLRKSCHFCRSRKIKCSGDTRCDACRERNLECSYNEGEPKGRPRVSKRSSESNSSSWKDIEQHIDTQELLSGRSLLGSSDRPHGSRSNSAASFEPRLTHGGATRSSLPSAEPGSVAAQLIAAFAWTDGTARLSVSKPTNVLENKVAMISDHINRHGRKIADLTPIGLQTAVLSYEDIFFTISQELIELLALRLGEIGCSQLSQDRSHYFVKSYLTESHPTMFDLANESNNFSDNASNTISGFRNPLLTYDSHELPQLLEIWFSQHPFSFMISKTLLLRDVRQDTFDDILVSAILTDVESARNLPLSQSKSHALSTWTCLRLGTVGKKDVRLTTIQAVILLGWQALCTGQARRALVFLAWAESQINGLRVLDQGVNVVNGVDVGAVEAESLKNTHWLLYSIFLWIAMQTRMTTHDLLPWESPASLPAAEANSLAMFRLDHASGSFSTLQSQESAYHELWLLSYIAAFVSQIYKLCPRILPSSVATDQESQDWGSEVWKRLRRLSDPMEDVLLICTQVRQLLHDFVQTSTVQQGPHSDTRALELTVVHTILIHLLLPASVSITTNNTSRGSQIGESESRGGRRILAAGGIRKLVDDFCASAQALHQMFAILQRRTPTLGPASRITMSQRSSTRGYIVLLALDACVRGLYSLWSLSRSGTELERQYLASRQTELRTQANNLLAFSNCLHIGDASRFGSVIEKLEVVLCYFDGIDFEAYSDLYGSSYYTSSNPSVRSRTPSYDETNINLNTVSTISLANTTTVIDTELQLQPHSFDMLDPSAMDFVEAESHRMFCKIPGVNTAMVEQWTDFTM